MSGLVTFIAACALIILVCIVAFFLVALAYFISGVWFEFQLERLRQEERRRRIRAQFPED